MVITIVTSSPPQFVRFAFYWFLLFPKIKYTMKGSEDM